ncbi:MAG: hypothetical protein IJP66_00090, partial [Kiritimatiellae bacterium]|nr:hypothetical protein [Kiritimatiellia bacterium]
TAALLFGDEIFTVSGTGVDGCGALLYVGSVSQTRAVFQNVVLAGDVRFGGPTACRWDLRGSGGQGTLDMGGHQLEITGSFGLCRATVSNPGGIYVSGSGAFLSLEGANVSFGGSSANTLAVGSGATLGLQKFGPALEWGVVLDGGKCQAVVESEDFMDRNRLNGPITINDGASFTGAGANTKRFVTLAGDIALNASSVGTGNNGVDLVVLQGGDDDGAQLAAYRALQSAADSRIRLLFCAANGVNATPVASAGDLGAGTFRINSTTNSSVALTGNQSGTALVSSNGVVTISGADKTHLFNSVTLAGTYPAVARLAVTNAAFGSSSTTVYAGREGQTRGLLEILDGTAATNVLNAGYIANAADTNDVCHGSVFVRGGEFVLPSSTSSYLGNRGGGYVEVSGGSVVVQGSLFLGATRTASACGTRRAAMCKSRTAASSSGSIRAPTPPRAASTGSPAARTTAGGRSSSARRSGTRATPQAGTPWRYAAESLASTTGSTSPANPIRGRSSISTAGA